MLVADGRHITLSDDPALVDIAQGAALQAVRSGSTLIYTYEIYNASAPVQSAVSVWRGRERVFDAPPDTLTPPPDAGRRFAAAGGLQFGENLAPGDYVLQIVAKTADPRDKRKQRTASQRVEFEVR